jgi:hypothetical protein
MAEAVNSSDRPVSQPRLVAALPGLFSDLRRADFDVGTEQYLAACDLLVSFNANRRTPGADELRASLSSVFCTSAAELARFSEVFTPWYRRLISSPIPSPAVYTKRPPSWAVTSRVERKFTWVGAIALCVLIAGVVVYVNWPASERESETPTLNAPVEPTQVPPSEYTPGWVNLARWLWLIPVLSWLAWILSRLFLRQVVLKRRRRRPGEEIRLDYLRLAGDRGELFSAPALTETWRHLRRFRSMRSQRLNEAATIDRTLESGGYFRPVYRERQVPPAYLFLVDRRHGEDHVAAIAGELGGALRRENIQVSSFDYYEDPRYCTPVGEIASERGPAALAGVYGDRDLIFVGDGDALFDRETGGPQPWIEEFSSFENKYMLTTEPVWRQSHRFDAITKAGFRLLPLTPAGLHQLGSAKDKISYDDPRDIPVPRRFAINPAHWLEERSPKRGSMQVLLRELREYMGQEGFLLLSATAAYPGIYWRLTRALDAQLGLTANDRTLRLRKLARLPWYRHGHMPDYFRVALLRALDRVSFRRVSDTYNALIEHRNDDQLRLPVAVPDWQNIPAELREMAQSSERHEPLGDQVFADVVRGRKPRLLEFALPNRFAPPLDRRRWRGLVLPLLAGLFVLPAAIWLNLWAWQYWFEPTARSQSLTRMQEQHQSLRVRIISTEKLRPIADALGSALSSWGFQLLRANATDKSKSVQQGLVGALDKLQQTIADADQRDGSNRVIYRPEKLALAKLVAARVSYLYYGVEPQLEQNKTELAEDTDMLVVLRDAPRGFQIAEKVRLHLKTARSSRERGEYSTAIAELAKAKSLDPANKEIQAELEQTQRACRAEQLLGRTDLRCK